MHLLHALVVVAAVGGHVAAMQDNGLQAQPNRLLRAATKRSDLYRRSVRITKRFETEMAYVDHENVWSDASTFASQVKVGSQKPVFNLEEHEHHLKAVKCDEDAMKLHFVDTSSARDARAACESETGGLIITSHEGCNKEGERSVYRVNDISFAEDGEALEVSVVRTTWREAFDHVNVTFGHTTDDHIYRRHSDFARIRGKRQNRVDIPQDTPDNVNTALFDLNSEIVDKTFATADFLDIVGGVVPIPELPVNVPIELGCKRCATTGQLALTQGAFNIDLSQIDLIPDVFQGGDDGKEISSVVTGGFMELVATGVGARLELFARPSASGAFEVALFQLPIAGFTIPGIGKAGAIFEPRVNFNFDVSGGLEVNCGLDLKVPDGSSIRVELTNLGGSKLTGFQDTSLTPLPVTVNITDVDILLGLAFKPSIPVGFEFLDQLKAEVSATLELPRLDAKLSSNIAANCGNGTNVTAPPAPSAPPAPPLPPFTNSTVKRRQDPIQLGPLALVEANVSISCDLAFDLSLPVLPPPFNAVSASQNLFKANFPLVSECKSPERAFEDSRGVIIPAPPFSASETSVPATNATAIPENSVPILNATTSAVITSDATATSTSVGLSTPSFQNTSASTTSPTFSTPSPLNNTSASSSVPVYLNATTPCSSTSLPLNTTTASVSAPSYLNSTTELASSTALASSSVGLNTTAASNVVSSTSTVSNFTVSSTSAVSNFTVSSTSAVSNFTVPSTSAVFTNTSTAALSATSSIASQVTTTTAAPSANATVLDPNFSFTLFSTSRRTRASSTSVVQSSTSEIKSSAEATSTQESGSSTSSEANAPVEATSTQESSVSSTSSSEAKSTIENSSTPSSSPAVSTDSSSTESAVTSSSTPASSSALASSTPASIATSTPIISSQPAASPSLAVPAPPPFPTEALQSLAATLSVAAGFLMPTNASALPALQTGVETFAGAATRDVRIPSMASVLGLTVGFIGIWVI